MAERWKRGAWRRYSKDRAVEFAEKAAWWTEQAEKNESFDGVQCQTRIALACAETSRAFMEAR